MRQTILHSITDIMAAVVDVMDMEKDKDRAGDSISRILLVRRPRCRESNSYKIFKRLDRARRLKRDATSVFRAKTVVDKI